MQKRLSICPCCATQFTPDKRGRAGKYCSSHCKALATRTKAKQEQMREAAATKRGGA